jgi:hypothetical protein
MSFSVKNSLMGGAWIGLIVGFGLVGCSGPAGGGAPGSLATIDKESADTMIDKGITDIKLSVPEPSTPSSMGVGVWSLGAAVDNFCTSGTVDMTRNSTEFTVEYDNCVVGSTTYDGTYSTKQISASKYKTVFDEFSMNNTATGYNYLMDGSIEVEEDAAGNITSTMNFEQYKTHFGSEYFEMVNSTFTGKEIGATCTFEADEWVKTSYTGGWVHIQTPEEISGNCDECPSEGVMTITGTHTIKVEFVGGNKMDVYLDDDLIYDDRDCD